MGDLRDGYVWVNVAGCAATLAAHVLVATGVTSVDERTGFVVLFGAFVPCMIAFLATWRTHPDARVHGLSVRLSPLDLWRTVPRWSLAVTACFLVYLTWFWIHVGTPRAFQSFAAMFLGICARLFWATAGVGLGALRAKRARRDAESPRSA